METLSQSDPIIHWDETPPVPNDPKMVAVKIAPWKSDTYIIESAKRSKAVEVWVWRDERGKYVAMLK